MHNLQRSELDSFNRISDVNTKHQEILNTIIEYQQEKEKFNSAVTSIKNAGITQNQQVVDQTTSLSIKTVMANTIVKYCLRAGVVARSLQNKKLADQLLGSAGVIISANKTEALEIAINKRKALYNNLNILINISEANIAEIDHVIAAYDAIKDAPTEERQAKKATATNQLPGYYKIAREAVESMYDLLYSYFEDTKPELVREFEEAKQVIITGRHSTSITFDCISDDDKSQIHNFTVTDINKNKTLSSNELGNVIFDHHLQGHFTFKIMADGHKEIELATIIKQRTNNHITAHLKKDN